MTTVLQNPLVSIIVPIYNVEAYIERCVRSIFGQAYNNLEFVFVDDGCTDSSMSILNKVIDEYPSLKDNIIIIQHQQNRGLAAARNTAVASCHGEFIIHVDSDDWIELHSVEALVKKQQETDADIVYTIGYYKHDKETKKIYCHGWSTEKKSILTNMLQDKATICMWSKLIKRTLYMDNGITCEEGGSFYEDFQVLVRLIYYSRKISCLDTFIYRYNRLNQSSFVSNLSKSIEIQRQGIVSIKVVCNFFQDKEIEYRDLAKQFYWCYCYKMFNANFRHRNREGYIEFLDILKQAEESDWYLIGWDKPWNRMIDCNYYLKVFSSNLRRLMQNAACIFLRYC